MKGIADTNRVELDEQDYRSIAEAIDRQLCGEDCESEPVSIESNGYSLTIYVRAYGSSHKEIGTMLSMFEYDELWCFDGYGSLEIVNVECEDGDRECREASIDESMLSKVLHDYWKFEKV